MIPTLETLSRRDLELTWALLNEAERRGIPIRIQSTEPAPDQWRDWLLRYFPGTFLDDTGQPIPLADFHAAFWDYVWAIESGVAAPAFFAIWPRGAGKSSNTELACAALAARQRRQYGVYVCSSQAQADDHVANVSSLLETPAFARQYPRSAQRKLNQYGASLGWRRNRLRTESGFTLDALGLDVAGRGRKLDNERPDLLVLDDLDDQADSPLIVARKIRALTRKILPAAGPDAIIFGAQNLIHPDSIFSQLLDGRARFLTRRIVSGPHPALKDMRYLETDNPAQPVKLTGGEPTWAGFSLARCQQLIDDEGLDAFLVERQHEVLSSEGLFFHGVWRDSVHIVPSFAIPQGWRIDRSFDWGSAHPFAVVWMAESDGSPVPGRRTYPAGTLFVVNEYYGCDPRRANVGIGLDSATIARNIRKAEDLAEYRGRIQIGPSDAIIYDVRDGASIAQTMAMHGVAWERFAGGPGSRVNGATLMKDRLRASLRGEGPGLYVFDRCPQTIRTIPKLPRDMLNPEDVESSAEDHLYDAIRNRILYGLRGPAKPRQVQGL